MNRKASYVATMFLSALFGTVALALPAGAATPQLPGWVHWQMQGSNCVIAWPAHSGTSVRMCRNGSITLS